MIGETEETCLKFYNSLCKLIVDLGFQLSHAMLKLPTQNLVFLGIEIDIVELSLTLPHSNLTDLKSFISSFCSRTQATKKQLQQLAHKLV